MCEFDGPMMQAATGDAIAHDKAVAQVIDAAGCTDAIGIVRVTRSIEAARPQSNAERVRRWRDRAGNPGFATGYVRPYQSMSRPPIPDCPQPDTPEIPPDSVIQFQSVTPATVDHERACVTPAQAHTVAGSQVATAAVVGDVPPASPGKDAAPGSVAAPGIPRHRDPRVQERVALLASCVETALQRADARSTGDMIDALESHAAAEWFADRAFEELAA